METILGAIGLGVTLLLFLVSIIIKQGRDHRMESNQRLDATNTRIDSFTEEIGHATVAVARIENDVQHLTRNVDGLTRWKDQLQEETIQRLRLERDGALERPPAVASAMRGRRGTGGSEE